MMKITFGMNIKASDTVVQNISSADSKAYLTMN